MDQGRRGRRTLPTRLLRPHPLNGQIYSQGAIEDLKASIARNGVLEPLVVTPQRVIISGHRRHAAAVALRLPEVPVVIRSFDDEPLALVEFNRQRIKTWTDRYRELEAILPALRESAAERRLAGARRGAAARHRLPRTQLGTKHGRCKVFDQAALITGLSRERVRKLIRVHEAVQAGMVEPRLIERLDAGEISVHRAYLAVVRAKVRSCGRASVDTETASSADLQALVRPFDIWNFPKRDPRFDLDEACGGKRKGLPQPVPGQLWVNVLYFYTAPGDLIVDVTAGTGTVDRVARWMGRRCLSYDISPQQSFVNRHDIARGFPDSLEDSPSLIVFDPPYGDQRPYSRRRGDLSRCRSQAEYLSRIERAIVACLGALGESGRLAVVMGNGLRPGWSADLAWEAAQILARHGRLERRVQAPYPPSHFPDFTVARARRKRLLLPLTREILIASGARRL